MNKKEKKEKPIETSFIEYDGKLYEQCYKKDEGVTFAVWDGISVDYKHKTEIDGVMFQPIYAQDYVKGLILLPEKAEQYESEEKLVEEIKQFLKKWLGVSESYYTIATYYILTTWVYDKFDTMNYMRALGDTGVGKSRFLDVIGGLCYKFTLISGAVTPAPVFRLLEKWKGTLGIEEADLKESDETNEIIKILNCGFEKNKPVVRCDKNEPSKIDTFEVYGPKVIVTRKEFHDQATEARCLTEVMMQDGSKPDTKTKDFYKDRDKLRNKLLMFRFNNYNSVNVDKALEIDLSGLEPRLRQASRGFLALVWDKPKLLDEFKEFLDDYNQKLIENRSSSWEGLIINALAEILVDGIENITCKTISDKIGIEKLTYRKVGSILHRFKLELKPKLVENKTKKVLKIDKNIIPILFDRYIPEDNLKKNAKISVINFTDESKKNITEITELTDTTKFEKEGKKTPPSPSNIVGNIGNMGNKNKIETIDLTPKNSQEFETNLIEFRKCSQPGCENYETNPDSEGNPFCKDHWTGYAKK
tara:strand:- start:3138 stop:4730 length:1593 start_codon:yes stop_codon:yes gene_type:complete